MMHDMRQRLGATFRRLLPVLVLLLFVLMGTAPLRLPFIENAAPPLVLMGVYFWAVFQPVLMPSWVVFVIGLLQDLLLGLPLGISPALLVLVHWIARAHRRLIVRQSFLVVWTGFFLMALLATVLEWVGTSLLAWHLVPVLPMVLRFLEAILLFPPLLLWGLHPANRAISGQE
ncbi:MAG TPA: rod shape-determining protein MreD [Rhodospirillaceae bacterium]|nr:MAG: rod shape-determining protein MreD [Alphaproteobacteria bacterium GWF2_58_20]HAU29152.1 rod shape-determining protein MreD [Rhodospirillaceae bacterium]